MVFVLVLLFQICIVIVFDVRPQVRRRSLEAFGPLVGGESGNHRNLKSVQFLLGKLEVF